MKARTAWLGALLLLIPLCPAADKVKKEFEVKGDGIWIDTGIDLKPGDLVAAEAAGEMKYSDTPKPAGPDGLERGWKDLIRAFPVNEAGRGALIGRIGESAAARAFLIGAKRENRAPIAGRFFLGINQDSRSRGEGSYKVAVEVTPGAAEHAEPYKGPLPVVTEEVLSKIPRRVVDPAGTEGDRVNFLVFGTEDQVVQALKDVGWVIVDKTVADSIVKGTLGTFSKQAYLTMPMSPLQVFGRTQDYGFAMSDPVMTVAERHHFRIWKAPFEVDGWTLFVGAGTHDVGFDKDQRNGKITHKIDPETDKEREFIGESLSHSGQVVKLDYVTPKDTITKAKTAHGQEFFSDGRILLIYLRPPAAIQESEADPKEKSWAESWGQKK